MGTVRHIPQSYDPRPLATADYTARVRRIVVLTVLAAAAAAAVRALSGGVPVAAEGNGQSGDEDRRSALRERISAARRRVRDELDSVRGD